MKALTQAPLIPPSNICNDYHEYYTDDASWEPPLVSVVDLFVSRIIHEYASVGVREAIPPVFSLDYSIVSFMVAKGLHEYHTGSAQKQFVRTFANTKTISSD